MSGRSHGEVMMTQGNIPGSRSILLSGQTPPQVGHRFLVGAISHMRKLLESRKGVHDGCIDCTPIHVFTKRPRDSSQWHIIVKLAVWV
jgi:hypothetical protein